MPTAVCKVPGRVEGRTYVVTGPNCGIGLETVGELARRGAIVVMAGRSMGRLEAAKSELLRRYGTEAGQEALNTSLPGPEFAQYMSHITSDQLILEILDLTSLASIQAFAERYLASGRKLHVLINNAGLGTSPFELTPDGFEKIIGTNHIGHFHLTNLLLPAMIATKSASQEGQDPDLRIINLTSTAHKMGRFQGEGMIKAKCTKEQFNRLTAYAQSKGCNIAHAKELAKRLEVDGIRTASVHPGVVRTELFRVNTSMFEKVFVRSIQPLMKTCWQGAQTTLQCTLDPKLESGAYHEDCRVKSAKAYAVDPENTAKLWEITEKLIAEAQGQLPQTATSNITVVSRQDDKGQSQGEGEANPPTQSHPGTGDHSITGNGEVTPEKPTAEMVLAEG